VINFEDALNFTKSSYCSILIAPKKKQKSLMNAEKLLISFGNIKVWFIDVQDLWGGFACLVADKSTSSIENQDELRMSTTHQKNHGFFSPFSSSTLHMQQQHQ
jgi:hypothetical protein